jgi:hypothetical protein
MSQDALENKTSKKLQREMSKAGKTADKIEETDVTASFSKNSETEREKSSVREPTGTADKVKTLKKRKDLPV